MGHSTGAAAAYFGNDYIAGGAADDSIFGELGNDTIQGDGSIDLVVGARRDSNNALVLMPSVDDYAGAGTDGDDYIEGGGGNDVIFGNQGQDDIIGGSSNLFSLATPAQRPDGSNMIFGGSGNAIGRSDPGDTSTQGHAKDADMILGDNGNIFRIVGTNGASSGSYLRFNYDNYDPAAKIVVRAARMLDYTPGGLDYNAAAAASNIGAADEIHGEAGDDFIFGMVGNDVLYGDGQNDIIIAGYGADWISGGTGDDGIVGDDGLIFASRNSTSYGEPLYGIAAIPAGQINTIISTPSGQTVAVTNVDGRLKYTADLTPYSVDPSNAAPTTLMPRPLYANDIIYGGLGNDSIHGGAGEDAISGAEAPVLGYVSNYNQAGAKISTALIESDFAHPVNPGNILGYNPTTTKFALYDANDPLRKILLKADGTLSKTGTGFEWSLNFNENEGPLDTKWAVGTAYPAVPTDGDDVIFGDTGSDWLVGGTGRDSIWAGWGDDYVQADDKLTTAGGLNSGPDTNPSWEDFVYGGAGRDVLVANTGGDRLVDASGEFNSFIVPYNPFGEPTVTRAINPSMEAFLYALSKSQGADQTLAGQYGSAPARNGEPFGELGLVRQGDAAAGDQTGGPRDPQGPVARASRDVRVSAGTLPIWQFAGGPTPTSTEGAPLSNAELVPVVAEAKQLWTQALGASDPHLAALDGVTVQVGNLPTLALGATLGDTILIDSSAAGWGWSTSLASPAPGRMDLLSTVLHEMGNAMGFAEDSGQAVMGSVLDPGVRTLPSGETPVHGSAPRAEPQLLFATLDATPLYASADRSSDWSQQVVDPTKLKKGDTPVRARLAWVQHSSPAYGHMDLLTVVMQEIGHVLDFEPDHANANVPTQEQRDRSVPVLLDAMGTRDNAKASFTGAMWLQLAIQGAERQDWSRAAKPADVVPAFVGDAGGGGSRSAIDGNERSHGGWGTRLSLFNSASLDSMSDFTALLAKTTGSNTQDSGDGEDGTKLDKSVTADKGVTFDKMGRILNSGKYTKADKATSR